LERAENANIPALVIEHSAYPSREAFEAAIHEQLEKYGARSQTGGNVQA